MPCWIGSSRTTDEAELRTFLDKHLKEELPGTESRAKSSWHHPAHLERYPA